MLALNIPLIVGGPAIEHQSANLLRAGLLIPTVDLGVRCLHPAVILVKPRRILIGFRNIDGQAAHGCRDGVHEVAVGGEVEVAVLEGWLHGRTIHHQSRIAAMRIGVQGNAIQSAAAQECQNVGEVAHPVAGRIGGILHLVVPRRHGPDNHLVVAMPRKQFDGIAAQAKATRIQVRRDGFKSGGSAAGAHSSSGGLALLCADSAETCRAAMPRGVRCWPAASLWTRRCRRRGRCYSRCADDRRPLLAVIHLVANNPKLAAGTGSHKVRHALGKVGILAAVGNRPGGAIAIVDAAEDAKILVGPRSKVIAAEIIGVTANFHCEDNPAATPRLCHEVLAAGIVQTEHIG